MPTLNVTTEQSATNGPLSVMLASPAGQRDQNIFETIEEAQEQVTDWLWTYNNDRPNMGIGGITPAMKLKLAA
ncbi:hypothetical protein JI58_01900 [Marinosulfonomonas sp. PRT-SC04]|nr:hypothetical protein JI58_01900 [Marinosulfonomonas sp. PRT-SC04]